MVSTERKRGTQVPQLIKNSLTSSSSSSTSIPPCSESSYSSSPLLSESSFAALVMHSPSLDDSLSGNWSCVVARVARGMSGLICVPPRPRPHPPRPRPPLPGAPRLPWPRPLMLFAVEGEDSASPADCVETGVGRSVVSDGVPALVRRRVTRASLLCSAAE